MHIEQDDVTRSDVIALLRYHLGDMAAHSPEGTSYALDVAALKTPDMSVYTIWDEAVLAGCGALHEISPVAAEIKSMRTVERYQKQGVGSEILSHLIDISKRRGYQRLSLETGTTPLFYKAIAFYARAGFVLGEPFDDYIPSRYNIFMHLDL